MDNYIISNIVSQFENNYKSYKASTYNESQCRLEFIDPLLNWLGWDVSNKAGRPPQFREVIVESYDTDTGRPDYSMTLNGIKKFFVEAKKPNVDITIDPDSVFQARKYGWSAKHKIVVLTNFEYLLVYDASVMPLPEDRVDVALMRSFYFKDYIEHSLELHQYTSKEFVYSGEFDKSFTDISGIKKQVDEVFLDQVNEWRLKLGQYLLDRSCPIEIINDRTQSFINQIIFLRICEDRNLPVYQKLIDTIGPKEDVNKKLTTLFKRADKRYNADLFNGDHIALDLNIDIVCEMIKALYYPKSPYAFNIIESSLLGQIYEMFLVKHLVLNDDGKVALEEKKSNKNRDLVTTRVEIVKYMTEKSLSPLLNNKTPLELMKLNIADISCGSGNFLVEAFGYILDYCIDWYKNNEPESLLYLGGDKYKLPIAEKKSILLNCIYGIDIDIHAVEIAKFNLFLKLLEDENTPTVEEEEPILPDLSKNICMGNALVDYRQIDKYKVNSRICEIAPFNWDGFNDGNKFDLIIGNPPYVKTEDMIALVPDKEFMIYKKDYKSAHKQFDKYFIFVERGMQKLNDNGVLCFIVPNKFSKNVAGKYLRKLITDGSQLREYTDFGSAQLFKDKTIYSSIIMIEIKPRKNFIYREVDDLELWWRTKDESSATSNIDHKLISENPWLLVSDKELLMKINNLYEKSYELKSVADVFNGIQTSAERPPVYWFSHDEIVGEDRDRYHINKFGKEYHIEKSIVKPYFKPVKKSEKNLYSYDILKTDKWIIFPYDLSGHLIDIITMQEVYPGTYKYLLDRYDLLLPKNLTTNGKGRDVPLATPDTWYQYGRQQSITAFQETDKLIVGVMSKKPMYIYDKNNFVIASGGTAGYCAIKDKEGSNYKLEYIQAYLSSPLIEKIVSILGSDFEGGFYSRGTSILSVIPVRKINFLNKHEKAIHDHVVKKANEVYLINSQLLIDQSKANSAILERTKEKIIQEDIIAVVSDFISS